MGEQRASFGDSIKIDPIHQDDMHGDYQVADQTGKTWCVVVTRVIVQGQVVWHWKLSDQGSTQPEPALEGPEHHPTRQDALNAAVAFIGRRQGDASHAR